MTPYYDADGITLYCGDLRDVLPTLDVQADLCLADPPYGETALEWDRWPVGWVDLVATSLKPNASLWCFGSMRMFLTRRDEFAGWKFAQDIVWEKQNGSGFDADRFRRVHELATHWYRGPWGGVFKAPVRVPYTKARNSATHGQPPHRGKIGGGEAARWSRGPGDLVLQTSVIYSPNCKGFADNETQKPEAIVRPLAQSACPPGGLILSPFAGSGTDLVVARSLGMRAIGIEMREAQCEAAVRRLSQAVLPLAAGGAA